ncbi:MAG: hypothetical protein M3400_14240, partial [Actinomycetota bacterium]|nr:hypothetical protein [Actinomycetota bacterium]
MAVGPGVEAVGGVCDVEEDPSVEVASPGAEPAGEQLDSATISSVTVNAQRGRTVIRVAVFRSARLCGPAPPENSDFLGPAGTGLLAAASGVRAVSVPLGKRGGHRSTFAARTRRWSAWQVS